MALSNAERQRRYRARVRSLEGDERLNRIEGIVRAEAAEALQRLADGYAVTKRGMLERLLTEAEGAVLARFDAESRDAYLKGMLPLGALRGNSLFASDSSELAVVADEQLDQGELFTLPSLVPDLAMLVESKMSASNVEPVASKSSASKGSREYPAETKARAVLAYKQGMKARDVRALIKAECREDPDSNLAKNIRAWEQQAAVVAILATLETEHCKTQ